MQDDSVAALISHATEERLKFLIEQIRSASQKRESLMISVRKLHFSLFLIEFFFELDDGKRRRRKTRKKTFSRRQF